MIDVSQVRWTKYRTFEGPVFVGNMPVPSASRSSPFHAKVLAITAAAEGGGFNATQMWDSGLLSVGAIQFIDAGTFNVCNMLGEVADKCGIHLVNQKLQPALDMCNAVFFKNAEGRWRFSHNGATVNTTAAQKMLYFGDASANTLGSYDDKKRLRVKTWVACMANVWDIPGATDVQMEFTLRNLKSGFVWGNLKSELFADGVSEDGYLGVTKAMLLAYAVNAPAVVVKMYDVAKSNGKEKFSPEWCLEVLRHVVVNGNIDVWKARWGVKLPFVKKAFGVTLPTYAQLVARAWDSSSLIVDPTDPPTPAPAPPSPSPTSEPIPTPPEPEPKPLPTPRPEPVPPTPLVVPPSGAFAILVQLVKMMMEVIARVLGKR